MPQDGEISAFPSYATFGWGAESSSGVEPHPHAEAYGLPEGHVYASDDDLMGPPSPPLDGDREIVVPGEPQRFYPSTDRYPQMVPAAPDEGPLVACPECGSGITRDRLYPPYRG